MSTIDNIMTDICNLDGILLPLLIRTTIEPHIHALECIISDLKTENEYVAHWMDCCHKLTLKVSALEDLIERNKDEVG